MMIVWLFLFRWTKLQWWHFSPTEIAMTLIMGVAAATGLGIALHWRTTVLRAFSWHDFRRTHATLLSDMGEPLKTAQAQLGHANLSTTADIYAHVVPASQRAAVERLEQAVGFLVDPSGPKTEGIVAPGSLLIQ